MSEFETVSVAAKLTMNTLGLDKPTIQELVKGKGAKPVNIAQVFCQVRGYKEKPSTLDSTKTDIRFVGNFEGVNTITGVKLSSGACFLPNIAADILTAACDSAGEGNIALVALTITAMEDKSPKSAVGYKFGAEVVMEKGRVDVFADLRKQLPAPTKSKK